MVQGNKIQLAMIREFQCPGCACGTYPDDGCPAYKLEEDYAGEKPYTFHCGGWHPGTRQGGVGRIALGLPKGFTRIGAVDLEIMKHYIRLYENPENRAEYNRFNIPVWAMEHRADNGENYLLVRVYSPRNSWHYIDVIKDGKMEMASFKDGPYEHKAINVGDFYDEID